MFSDYFKKLSSAKKLAVLALFLALSVVANTVLDIDITPQNKITITYFIMFASAVFLGAVPTLFVGFVGDLIGHLLMPDGTYWLYGLTLGLLGFTMGCMFHYLPIKNQYVKTSIIAIVCYILFTVVINSIINYTYTLLFLWGGHANKTLWVYLAAYLPPRLLIQTIVYVGNFFLCFAILPVFQRIIKRTGV